jgi:hypothetical protein
VFLEDALDADAAAQEGTHAAGVRASWRRPAPPALDPALSALGTRTQRTLRRAAPALTPTPRARVCPCVSGLRGRRVSADGH